MKKQNKKSRKIILISMLITITVIIILITLYMFLSTKKISCTKTSKESGVLIKSRVNVKMHDANIKKIVVNKEISILEDDKKMNYLDVIKTTLESHYKRAGITYNIKIEDNYLFVKLIYDKNKYYILDDLYILKNDSGININFISEDNDGNYASISLSKQYKYKNMIKIIEKADYKCK